MTITLHEPRVRSVLDRLFGAAASDDDHFDAPAWGDLRSASAQDDPAAQLLDKTIRQHFSM